MLSIFSSTFHAEITALYCANTLLSTPQELWGSWLLYIIGLNYVTSTETRKKTMWQMWLLWPSICKQQQFLHRFTHLHALWFYMSQTLTQENTTYYYAFMIYNKYFHFPALCRSLQISLMHITVDLFGSHSTCWIFQYLPWFRMWCSLHILQNI